MPPAPGLTRTHTDTVRKPHTGVVYEVLKTALGLRDYGLFPDVMTWAGPGGVDSRTFHLLKALTGPDGPFFFAKFKQR